MSDAKTFKVTLVKSPIRTRPNHRACVKGMGLRRIGHTVELVDTPSNRGLANKVDYMVRIEGE